MSVPARDPCKPLVAPGAFDLHLRDMTATFSADMTLKQAQDALAEHGQWLAADGDDRLTLGTLIAQNSTGPLRLGYGGWRDLLLGCQFLDGQDNLITAGGKTVKNVAGYDLTKLMVGQHGCLGRLVTVTTRTYRRPSHALCCWFPGSIGDVSALIGGEARPQWLIRDEQGLYAGYLGDEPAIEFFAARLSAAGDARIERLTLEREQRVRDGLWLGAARQPRTLRASIPPAKVDAFIASLTSGWAADAAFGVVVSHEPAHRWPAIAATARHVGGSATLWDGGSALVCGMDAHAAALLVRLKRAFDPQTRLSPLPQFTP
jgi:hypothetical protein